MTEDKDVLIFEAVFDAKKADEAVAQFKTNLTRLREEKKATDKEFKSGAITAEEYGRSIAAIDKQIASTSESLKNQNKAIADNAKYQKSAEGSIVQMRLGLAALVSQYDNLSKAERNNEAVGGQLEARIKSLSSELLSLESATGRNQRNVGNYAGAIEPLIQELVKLQEQQKAVGKGSGEFVQFERQIIGFQQQINRVGASTGQTFDEVQNKVRTYGEAIRGTTSELVKLEREQKEIGETGGEAFDRLGFQIEKAKREIAKVPSSTKSAVSALEELDDATGALGGGVGRLRGYLTQAKTGLDAMKVGLTGIRGAIAATGIGLLLIALASLYAFLTKTQEGMDFVERKTKAVGLAFDVLVQRAALVGKALVEVFTNPKKAVEDFFAAFKGAGSAIAEAARAGEEIAKLNQKLLDDEQKLNLERAKSRAEFERQKKIADDQTLSAKKRLEAADKANAIEIGSTLKLIALQKQKIANMEREQKISGKTRANEEAINNERIEAYRLEEDIYDRTTELQNTRNAIVKEAAEKAKQAAQEAIEREKYRVEQLLFIAKTEKLIAEKKGQDTLKIEEKIIEREAQLQLVGLKKNSTERKLIEAQTNAKILEARVEHAKKLVEEASAIERAIISTQITQALEGSTKLENLRLRQLKREADDRKAQLKADFDLRKISKQRYEAELNDVDQNLFLNQNNIRKQFAADRINKETELAKLEVQTELNKTDQLLSIRRNRATDIINIEEKQQLDLLALQELSAEEYATREAAIQAEAEARRKEVYRQIQADERADRKAQIETKLADVAEGGRKELELRKKLLKEQLADELSNTELSEKQKEAIKAKYRKDEEALVREHEEKVVGIIIDSLSQSVTALSNVFDAQATRALNTLEDQQKAILSSAALSSDAREQIEIRFQKKKEKIEKDAAEKRRRIATIENIISVARGITDAIIKNVGNPFMQALQTALVLATGASQQAIIASQKFRNGGEIDGPSHERGGVKYLVRGRRVELEGGEGVINKRSMQIPGVREAASHLNELGGGVRFPGVRSNQRYISTNFRAPKSYTPPSKMALGGEVAVQYTQSQAQGVTIDYEKLGGIVASNVLRAAALIPAPVVVVKDIQDGVSKRVTVQQRADK
ncbi:coiled-coil domain-containing protein [Spirosoma fluminis]